MNPSKFKHGLEWEFKFIEMCGKSKLFHLQTTSRQSRILPANSKGGILNNVQAGKGLEDISRNAPRKT